MSDKLSQALALQNGRRSSQFIQLDDFPVLEGPRMDQIQMFNERAKIWKRKTEVRLSEQINTTNSGNSSQVV